MDDVVERQSTPLADRDYRTLARFRKALRVFVRSSEHAARDAGTTPAQHQLLLAIKGYHGDEPPVIADIAESLQLRHHSIVGLVDRAQESGLVRRQIDPDDHRRQQLILTSAGSEVLEQLSTFHRDELRRFRAEMVDVLRELD